MNAFFILAVVSVPALSPWLMLAAGAALFIGGVAIIVTGKHHDSE